MIVSVRKMRFNWSTLFLAMWRHREAPSSVQSGRRCWQVVQSHERFWYKWNRTHRYHMQANQSTATGNRIGIQAVLWKSLLYWTRVQSTNQDIKAAFIFKDLIKEVKSELKGNFENLLVACLQPTIEFEIDELRDAVSVCHFYLFRLNCNFWHTVTPNLKGVGTDEVALIDLICTKTNAEIMQLKNAYRQSIQVCLWLSIAVCFLFFNLL